MNINRVKVWRVAFVLGLLLVVGGCDESPEQSSPGLLFTTRTPSTISVTSVTATADPASVATPTPSPPPTATPSPTITPSPTPTPVPLPKVCLRQEFARDVENCGAIPYYDISMVVDAGASRVTGHQEVRYTNLEDEPLDYVYLRFFPNTPSYGGTMTVTNFRLNGRFVPPIVMLKRSAWRLSLKPPLAIGQSVTLSMNFAVEVPTTGDVGHALFTYQRGVMSLPTIYPFIPVYDDEGWNVEIAPEYSDDTYSDIAVYQVQVTAPATMTLVTSGACVRQTQKANMVTWECGAAPVRDFVLVLGENFELANRVVDGVVVNSYFYEGHEKGGGQALTVATDALKAFSELFGPYPYAELDVVETPNSLGGMEYPGLVVLADRLYPGGARLEWLVAHEVAHQWWFGVVGSDQIDEPWLDEALTQYSTMLYYEKVYGPERAASILQTEFVQVHQSLVRQGRDMLVGLPASAYGPVLYWQIVYDKGALYFHELRQAVGDDAFFEILQQYYSRHQYRIATPESFLDVVESVTGDRHLGIFEAWIARFPE